MNQRILIATRKGLFTLQRGSADKPRWGVVRTDFLGSPVSMALADARDGSIYAALAHGHFGAKLHRSDDHGTSWKEVAVPQFPEGSTETLMQVWSLEGGGAGDSNLLWAGCIPAGLFWSRDRGATWTLVESLWSRPERSEWFGGGFDKAGIHSVCVDPRDHRRLVVAVSCGGLWATSDGGASWTLKGEGLRAEYMPAERQKDLNIQDPHRLARCAGSPDAFWIQHHNGVFRSVDGAESWTEIAPAQPSSFGFAVAAHPKDPLVAWFVPAVKDECRVPVGGRLVVTRTRDGGASFEALSAGLPAEPAYDLVYRHALDVDSTGNRLVIGSTTGGVWVSEDGGDHFDAVATRFPPVYCVRFVG